LTLLILVSNNKPKAIVKEGSKENALVLYIFLINPGQPRTLLQLKLVGILTINLFLTYYTTQ
jgi:hypothetical protein